MIALGKILYSALSNDAGVAALVDDRIYPNVIPQEIERPCISYEVGSLPGIDGTAPVYSTTVVVSCFAREKSLAHGVATLADAVLSPLRGAADGVELRSMSRSSYQDGFDPDLDAYAVVVTYTAMLVLSADANTVWAAVPAAQIDHGGLAGLGDDDHPQYLKVANYTSPPTRVFAGDFSDVVIPGAGDDLKFGRWNNTLQRLEWAPVSVSPGGSSGQVQYHGGSGFAGHSGFIYDGAGKMTLATALVVPAIRPSLDSNASWKLQNAAGTTDVVTLDSTNGLVQFRIAKSSVFRAVATSQPGMIRNDSIMEIQSSDGASIYWDLRNDGQPRFYSQMSMGAGCVTYGNIDFWAGGIRRAEVTNVPLLQPNTTNFLIHTIAATNTGLIIRGATSQSANLQEWQNSGNTVQFAVGPTGKILTNQAVSNTNTPSGATTKAVPLYDIAGTLLGYFPLFASLW